MQVKELMTTDVISVSPDALIGEVAKLLNKHRIHGVPVAEDGKLIGIITETDFFTKGSVNIYLPLYIDLVKKDASLGEATVDEKAKMNMLLNTRAKDIMTTPCITVNKEDDVHELLGLMKGRDLHTVPVVDDKGDVCGIITFADIIMLLKIN